MRVKKTTLLLIISFLVCTPYLLQAQIIHTPVSQERRQFELKDIAELELAVPSERIAETLKQSPTTHRLKRLQYAMPIEVNKDFFTIGSSGQQNGTTTTSLHITSTGAYSLGVYFSSYFLMPGSTVNIYNLSGELLLGPLTHAHNKSYGTLMLRALPGDELILVHESCHPEQQDLLAIGQVYHDFIDIAKYIGTKKEYGYGSSGACNIDINCPEGEKWQTTKKSVCKITYNGFLCSGALINNVKKDKHPYLLTANHCIRTKIDAEKAIFYFNYENAACNGTQEPIPQTISGSTIIATGQNSNLDFTLLELTEAPPAAYDVYFAGWNIADNSVSKGASIHHPDGDVKKISIPRYAPITGNYGSTYDLNSHWQITEWQSGTTEGGSSGSPLFDGSHRIIGDLTGGDASCAYNFDDFYAKLSKSWDDYSTPANQLKAWLNPWDVPISQLNGLPAVDDKPSNVQLHSKQDTLVHISWFVPADTIGQNKYFIYQNQQLTDSTLNCEYIDSTAKQNIPTDYVIALGYKKSSGKDTSFSVASRIRTMQPIQPELHETFSTKDSMPALWYEISSADTVGWKFSSSAVANGPSCPYAGSHYAIFNDTTEIGQSKLITPKLDLSGLPFVYLKFYYALPAFKDQAQEFTVYYRLQDSLPWVPLKKYDSAVASWEKEQIGLPQLSNALEIAFEGKSHPEGPGILLDSIAIIEDKEYIDVHFASSENTICVGESAIFSTNLPTNNDFLWHFGTDAQPQTATGIGPHEVSYTSSGLKDVSLKVNNKYYKKKYGIVQVGDYSETPTFTTAGRILETTLQYGIQWYFDNSPIDNATNSTYAISETGYYKLAYTNAYGCTSFSPPEYVIYTHIESAAENGLRIAPNPTSGYITLTLPMETTQGDVRIYDTSGRLVFIKQVKSHKSILHLELNPGSYIFEVTTHNKKMHTKLLIGY